MPNNDIYCTLGKIFYKYIEDDLTVYRIVGFSNQQTVKAKVIEGKNKDSIITMKYKDVCENYTFLIEDGKIILSTVDVGNRNTENGLSLSVSDVIVAEYRTNDINEGNTDPWCVCRQNITDVFSQLIVENLEDALVGLSVTKDSMPEGLNYQMMLACEKIINTVIVNIYLNDTLDDLLSLIKVKAFDSILNANVIDHIRSVEAKLNRKLKLKPGVQSVDGYCLTLKQLLKENNFWYDVEEGFNIISINSPIEIENDSLSENMKFALSNIIRKPIDNTIVIKYDMDIDLSEFRNEYILVRDSNKDLYVIGFTTTGVYIEPDMENEIIKKKIQDSINMISVDKSKYL